MLLVHRGCMGHESSTEGERRREGGPSDVRMTERAGDASVREMRAATGMPKGSANIQLAVRIHSGSAMADICLWVLWPCPSSLHVCAINAGECTLVSDFFRAKFVNVD